MVYPIKLLPEAYEDLKAIELFYDNQVPRLGQYCVDLLFSELDRLSYFAGVHAKVKGCHRMLVQRFPLSIYYSVSGECVTVIAILDNRQNPIDNLNRLN